MDENKTPSLSLDGGPAAIVELLSESERKALEEKHGEVTAVKTKAGVAVFRRFTRGEYALYNKYLFDEKTRPQAFEALVSTCVVQPEASAFQAWLNKYPGITQTCLNAVLELGGVDTEAQTKKYGTA
jgi:hypothetical protein